MNQPYDAIAVFCISSSWWLDSSVSFVLYNCFCFMLLFPLLFFTSLYFLLAAILDLEKRLCTEMDYHIGSFFYHTYTSISSIFVPHLIFIISPFSTVMIFVFGLLFCLFSCTTYSTGRAELSILDNWKVHLRRVCYAF
jgi:hypothetical protein